MKRAGAPDADEPPEQTPLAPEGAMKFGFVGLVWSDYQAQYRYKVEGSLRRRVLFIPRVLTNASLHATLLVRLSHATPAGMAWLWRRLLLSMHSSDIPRSCTIGPGLQLPHPFGIAIGANTIIGCDVVLHHNTTMGPPRGRWLPRPGTELGFMIIKDRVVVYTGAVMLGNITIGEDAVVGAQALVTEDIPPGYSFTRGKLRSPASTRP